MNLEHMCGLLITRGRHPRISRFTSRIYPWALCFCFVTIGCNGKPQSPKLVDEQQLRAMVNSSERDKVSSWLYMGTDQQYHYFLRHYLALPPFCNPQIYFRINKESFEMPDTLQATGHLEDDYLKPGGRSVFMKMVTKTRSDGTVFHHAVFDLSLRGTESW